MSDTTSAAFAQAAASEKLSLLLAKVSSEALVSQNRDVFFNNALRELGQCLEAGRVYLFRKSNGLWHNTYEWCAEGVAPQSSALQNIPPEEVGWFVSALEQGRPLCIEDVRRVPHDRTRELLLLQGIRSLLAVPLRHDGALDGFFGVDICNRHVRWTESMINMAVAVANVLCGADLNFRQRAGLARKSRQLADILDAFVEPVYISDMDTYEVLFSNKALNEHFPQRPGGDARCFARFQGLDAPCPFCTNAFLRGRDNPDSPHHWVHVNPCLLYTSPSPRDS